MAPMPNGGTVFEISRRGHFRKKDIFENFSIPHKIKITFQGIPKFSEMSYSEFPFHLTCLLDFCMNGSLLEIEHILVCLELFLGNFLAIFPCMKGLHTFL